MCQIICVLFIKEGQVFKQFCEIAINHHIKANYNFKMDQIYVRFAFYSKALSRGKSTVASSVQQIRI